MATTPKQVEAWEGPHGTLHPTRVQALQAFEYENYLKWLANNTVFCPRAFVGLSNIETFEWLYNHLEDLQKVLRP